jgi:hypothetical protein
LEVRESFDSARHSPCDLSCAHNKKSRFMLIRFSVHQFLGRLHDTQSFMAPCPGPKTTPDLAIVCRPELTVVTADESLADNSNSYPFVRLHHGRFHSELIRWHEVNNTATRSHESPD